MKSDPPARIDLPLRSITLDLPDWLLPHLAGAAEQTFDTDARKLALAIELARENVRQTTGGPFGAAIFSADGRLVSVGVNLVLAGGASIWHAEVVAIVTAQRATGQHRLGADDGQGYTLASSCEPCAMCLGAIGWSGVRHVVCGARDEDVRAVGFDEGDKPADWIATLAKRNTAATPDILRDDAIAVLKAYLDEGGTIY